MHKPMDPGKTPRFSGIGTFMRLPHTTELAGVDFTVMGVPFDTGSTFRVGARFGPSAIRRMSALLRTYNPALGVEPFRYLSGTDYGDLPVVPGYIEESYRRIQEALAPVVQAGVIPIMLGGDHSVSLPELRAVARNGPVALVHFDSHPDAWDGYFGQPHFHGSPFLRAVEEGLLDPGASTQVGIRGSVEGPEDLTGPVSLGFRLITAQETRSMGSQAVLEEIHRRAKGKRVFVSFDIDFVDPAYAPGTGTPEVGGFTSLEALELVRGLDGLDFAAFDLVEVVPQYDSGDVTALLAANIVYEFISLLAVIKS
ncbi:MAG: agmatinase [Bacillota bacterium]